jgi:hypothetical protein
MHPIKQIPIVHETFPPRSRTDSRTFVIPVVHDSIGFRTPSKLGTIIPASERRRCEAGQVVPITSIAALSLWTAVSVCARANARVKDEACRATRANECGRLCMERED